MLPPPPLPTFREMPFEDGHVAHDLATMPARHVSLLPRLPLRRVPARIVRGEGKPLERHEEGRGEGIVVGLGLETLGRQVWRHDVDVEVIHARTRVDANL